MSNTKDGNRLLEVRKAAENALKALDPAEYRDVGQWLDEELYRGLYGRGGASRLPIEHKSAVMDLLRARARVYRGKKSGTIVRDDSRAYDSEVGNELMAQAIEACLAVLGDGADLPPEKRWDDFLPERLL